MRALGLAAQSRLQFPAGATPCLFQEPATAARLVCIGLIVAGIIGLKLTSGG